jgi:hypothetical protein
MPGRPAISVLLPTWNAISFLPAAVESILTQTFDDLELVIVDDASDDATPDYLASISDPRVRVLRNQTNLGVTESLNHGLDACIGCCIARMDADDIAEPDRLAAQFALLEANAEVGIVGSSRTLINEAGETIGVAPAMTGNLAIRWKCLLGNPLPHPTVMIRRAVLDQHALRYDPAFRSAQDYELWTRLLCVTKAANVARPLLQYRICASSISRSRTVEQCANHDRIALLANQRLLPSFPLNASQLQNLRGRYGGASVRDQSMAQSDIQWLQLLDAMLTAFGESHRSSPGIEECFAQQQKWIAAFGTSAVNAPTAVNTLPDSAAPLIPSPRTPGEG